jgi:hypothetical protein
MRKARKASRRTGGELRAEYKRSVFGPLVRGKYARRIAEATNVEDLDPELARAFPNDRAVNKALREVLRARKSAPRPSKGSSRSE